MKTTKEEMVCGSCSSCGCGCGHSNVLGRWILGIIVIVLIFALGMKFGELKSVAFGGAGWSERSSWCPLHKQRALPVESPIGASVDEAPAAE